MLAFLRQMARVFSVLSTLALWISGIGLVLMTAIVAWQVFGRYVLGSTPKWAEASAILLMAWFIFLGAAVGVRERYHLGFDILLYVVPVRVKQALRFLSDFAVMGFGVGMLWYGAQLTAHAWKVPAPTLGIPGGVSFLPIVVGGGLIILFTLERILGRAAGLDPDGDLAPENDAAAQG